MQNIPERGPKRKTFDDHGRVYSLRIGEAGASLLVLVVASFESTVLIVPPGDFISAPSNSWRVYVVSAIVTNYQPSAQMRVCNDAKVCYPPQAPRRAESNAIR